MGTRVWSGNPNLSVHICAMGAAPESFIDALKRSIATGMALTTRPVQRTALLGAPPGIVAPAGP